ncbi:MAG: glycine cleavage system protein GcvH [Candidatus Rariloculaceae bacterium]
MSHIPGDLRYTKDHEWVREQDDGTIVLGITDHAQVSLGDLVFVELPENDTAVEAGDACAVVESVKAASDVYLPLSGTIIETNTALDETPELVNSDPYGDGWLFSFKPDTPAQLDELLASDDYERLVAESTD